MDYVGGIPAFTNASEPVADVVGYTQDLRTALIGAGGLIEDSGWKAIQLNTTTAQAQTGYAAEWRRIGNLVALRGRLRRLTTGPSITNLGTLPADARPTQAIEVAGLAPAGGVALTFRLFVTDAGALGAQYMPDNPDFLSLSGVQYLLD